MDGGEFKVIGGECGKFYILYLIRNRDQESPTIINQAKITYFFSQFSSRMVDDGFTI